MYQVYLLTGRPGTGKTSLIKQAIAELKSEAGGFYTEEIRHQGIRLGFRLVTLDGREVILAHTDFNKRYRVGKYGIDIESLDRVGVSALHKAVKQCELVVIDEIGKMELLSTNFRKTVSQIISSGKTVLGTVMFDSNPWADAIKSQSQVNLVTVTRDNYQQTLDDLRRWLRTAKIEMK